MTTAWDGWPNGIVKWHFTNAEAAETKDAMIHWAFQNHGSKKGNSEADRWEDGKQFYRHCLGAIKCSNPECSIVVHPVTCKTALEHQLAMPCKCGSKLHHLRCHASMTLWKYKHRLYHPSVGPLRLIVGVPTLIGPGHSVADISSVLLNIDRVKKEQQKLTSTIAKGGDELIAGFAEFEENNLRFIIHKTFGSVTVICMQSTMLLAQIVKDCILDDGLNGLVSDAAHGFWEDRNAVLIITSGYSPLLNRWVPGILSYVNGRSSEHFKHHFYALFKSIAEEAKRRGIVLTDELFSGVIDFSEAERDGFVAAFVCFWQSQSEDKHSEHELLEAASKHLHGCAQHFAHQSHMLDGSVAWFLRINLIYFASI
ncbi:uncharacterized protein LAESUDRAFT_649357 [Laetiporus sulphureus 93-53]|uniref:Uncharacterized protein n=1 Tax=Laetiporus sulphureus 93-53 TaxID=1314785 RepID=A0A165F3E0_9APHY|nr:uncharacterized protein LAESUDRAFT_649357 [Laetiporus sulphureus 93-53]KZT08296.1 hypothetical protein LAESUDRAFT_649357 [Laetiporus sulphureus 93-53]